MRRDGKSLNMSMLYYFFVLEADKYGVELKEKFNMLLFEGGKYFYGDKAEQFIDMRELKIVQD
ncbi:MAG: hypothetical protein KDD45_02200 [Bdellovibrionales bacterium]|nr:hypothetical protein [Bdellovibrionales bacterium]